MIIWINGPFGAGKTTTAAHLVPLLSDARLWDPELVGYLLGECLADRPVEDFQDWPPWRSSVVSTTVALAEYTHQDIVAVQTVLRHDYWSEIADGLRAAGQVVFHVLLTADEASLRRRIEAGDEAHQWRLDHLRDYERARSWMAATADLVVDTSDIDAAAAARRIARRIEPAPGPAPGYPDGDLRE